MIGRIALWSWSTSAKDAGSNQIKAQVRDGMHASEDGFDGELSVYFTLSEPARSISGNAFEERTAMAGWTIPRLWSAGWFSS